MDKQRQEQIIEFLDKQVEKKIASQYQVEAYALKERRQTLEGFVKELEDTNDQYINDMKKEFGYGHFLDPYFRAKDLSFAATDKYLKMLTQYEVEGAALYVKEWPVKRAELNQKLVERCKVLRAKRAKEMRAKEKEEIENEIKIGDKKYDLLLKYYTDIHALQSMINKMEDVNQFLREEAAFYKKTVSEVVDENITSPEITNLIDEAVNNVIRAGNIYPCARVVEDNNISRAYNHILDLMIKVDAKDRNKHFTKDIKKLIAKETGVTNGIKSAPEAKPEDEELERE